MVDTIQQNIPAKATVVNFGVSFLHLNDTENIEKPKADTRPKTKPMNELFPSLPKLIIKIPIDAKDIEIHTPRAILSLRNKKPSKAVIKGIAAKQSNVMAAVVWVIDQIKEIIANPRPEPPITPEIPILK